MGVVIGTSFGIHLSGGIKKLCNSFTSWSQGGAALLVLSWISVWRGEALDGGREREEGRRWVGKYKSVGPARRCRVCVCSLLISN
jgi:hypothetical protein